jgi:hypothetical protein
MQRIVTVLLLICVLTLNANAQKKLKPWTEWSEKETQKMLSDSPWGQTQTDTNTSEMFYSETGRPSTQRGASSRPLDSPGTSGSDRTNQGALNQAINTNYRIRLLTAKPIRQAIARQAQLQNPQLAEQLKAFAEQQTDKYIVVAVNYDSTDQRFTANRMQIFNSINTGVLKNNTYLETKDGQRIFLQQYIAPINDGMGAKFVFPRTLNNEPFVTPQSGYLRFYSDIDTNIKLNMRFKVSEMIYDGKLEY